MLGENVSLGQALGVTVFSMVVVFVTLLVISFILTGFKSIFKENKRKVTDKDLGQASKDETIVESTDESEDEELIAVISASIASSLSVSTSQIKIKNIVRISQNTSPWSRAGKLEQMNS